MHPETELHESSVQANWSSQETGGWLQAPPKQSSYVQAFPSLQLRGVWTHPRAGSQLSSVHDIPSLQEIGPEKQFPLKQPSGAVQRLPSLQAP
jgi:hypothetical protein